MNWRGALRSSNVEDRRGMGRAGLIGGGGVGTVVIALVLYFVFGVNPSTVLDTGGGSSAPGVMGAPSDEQGAFVSTILKSTEEVWTDILGRGGNPYRKPTVTLYEQATRTGCGTGQAAMGPFYCPADEHVYLDLEFFDQLATRYGSPGEFARAYVIAHEIGHHVQTLTGKSGEVHRAQQRTSEREANQLSVRLELQADCYAGVWAMKANDERNWLEPGDVEGGLRAASAIGDDTLQRQSKGRVVPDSFTHGSSEQRMKWFTVGFKSGKAESCDTFGASAL